MSNVDRALSRFFAFRLLGISLLTNANRMFPRVETMTLKPVQPGQDHINFTWQVENLFLKIIRFLAFVGSFPCWFLRKSEPVVCPFVVVSYVCWLEILAWVSIRHIFQSPFNDQLGISRLNGRTERRREPARRVSWCEFNHARMKKKKEGAKLRFHANFKSESPFTIKRVKSFFSLRETFFSWSIFRGNSWRSW